MTEASWKWLETGNIWELLDDFASFSALDMSGRCLNAPV
jgi:hypothetical protein